MKKRFTTEAKDMEKPVLIHLVADSDGDINLMANDVKIAFLADVDGTLNLYVKSPGELEKVGLQPVTRHDGSVVIQAY